MTVGNIHPNVSVDQANADIAQRTKDFKPQDSIPKFFRDPNFQEALKASANTINSAPKETRTTESEGGLTPSGDAEQMVAGAAVGVAVGAVVSVPIAIVFIGKAMQMTFNFMNKLFFKNSASEEQKAAMGAKVQEYNDLKEAAIDNHAKKQEACNIAKNEYEKALKECNEARRDGTEALKSEAKEFANTFFEKGRPNLSKFQMSVDNYNKDVDNVNSKLEAYKKANEALNEAKSVLTSVAELGGKKDLELPRSELGIPETPKSINTAWLQQPIADKYTESNEKLAASYNKYETLNQSGNATPDELEKAKTELKKDYDKLNHFTLNIFPYQNGFKDTCFWLVNNRTLQKCHDIFTIKK